VAAGLSGIDLLALDLRGHGDSERPDAPYDVATCAADVLAAVEAWRPQSRVVLVGHSWGASVAVAAAASCIGQVAAAVASDGGAFPTVAPGRRDELRRMLTPPRLALPPAEIAELYATGPLAPWWTPAHADAVLPGWAVDGDGLARSRLGFERHMAVLDGLLEHDGELALNEVQVPLWLVTCEPPSASADVEDWLVRREAVLQQAMDGRPERRLLRWTGALHDVPLQWPDLVAGLIRTVAVETQAGER
jgi:pimeloyl-ACP methyl ester carboxylesterase